MVAAPEEQHLAVVVARRLHVDLHQGVLAMGAVDLVVRYLDEIGVVQHAAQRGDQLVIGAIEGGGVEPGMRGVELGAEVEVVVAELLEPVEILVVIDRAEQLAELAKFLAVGFAAETAVGDHGVENVDLAGGNEMIPLAAAA